MTPQADYSAMNGAHDAHSDHPESQVDGNAMEEAIFTALLYGARSLDSRPLCSSPSATPRTSPLRPPLRGPPPSPQSEPVPLPAPTQPGPAQTSTGAAPPDRTPTLYPCPVPSCAKTFKDFGGLIRHLQSQTVRARPDHHDPCCSGPGAPLFQDHLAPHGVVACPICCLPCASAAGLARHRGGPKCKAPNGGETTIPAPRAPDCPEEGGNFLSGSAWGAMQAVARQQASDPPPGPDSVPSNTDLQLPPTHKAREWAASAPSWLDSLPSLPQVKSNTPGEHAAPFVFPIFTAVLTDLAHARSGREKHDAFTVLSAFCRCMCRPYRGGASPSEIKKEARRRAATWRRSGPAPLLAEAAAAARGTMPPSSRKRRESRSRRLRHRPLDDSLAQREEPDIVVEASKDARLQAELARLARGQQFGSVMPLVQDYGLPPDPKETGDRLEELQEPPLDPPPSPQELAALYGAPVPTSRTSTACPVSLEHLLEYLKKANTCASPFRDNISIDFLATFATDSEAAAAALLGVVRSILQGDLPPSVAGALARGTLIGILKEEPSVVDRQRSDAALHGEPFKLPLRPITFGSAIGRVALGCLLLAVKDPITEAVGDDQFGLFTRGGAEMMQLAVQAIFEELPHLAVLSVDARNAFNAISREAILAALQANPRLHCLIPAFKMLYLDRPTELLYYENGPNSAPRVILSRRGVRQGCPLGSALFCIALTPVLRRLRLLAGPEAIALSFVDDMAVALLPERLPAVDAALDPVLGSIGLDPVRDRGKSFAVPHRCGTPSLADSTADSANTCSDPMPLPSTTIEQRPGFKKCLGCPRHPSNDSTYILQHLKDVEARHDRLLAHLRGMARAEPHAALRILQVVGVRRFQHLMRTLPPSVCDIFLQRRDEAIRATLEHILHLAPDTLRRFAEVRARMPHLLGGANVPSLHTERNAAFVAAHALTLGPLCERLRRLRGPTHSNLASRLLAYAESPRPWASALRSSFHALQDQLHLQPWMVAFLDDMAPLYPSFAVAGDEGSAQEVPSRFSLHHPLSDLQALCPPEGATSKLVPRLSFRLRAKELLATMPHQTKLQRLQLLSSSGPGSVAFISSDSDRAYDAPAELIVASVRRAVGLPCLDRDRTPISCPFCRQTGTSIDVLLHMLRCGRSPCFHTAHAVLAQTIRRCCEQAGATNADLRGGKRGSAELRGLRPDGTRPGDVVWLDYHGKGRHLLIDATVASVFCPAMLKSGCFDKPGLAAAKAEARKFSDDAKSVSPVGGQHRLVPFAVEESGRFGKHALALLRELASRGVKDGYLKPPTSWRAPKQLRVISYWVSQWLQDISLSLSHHLSDIVLERAVC